MPTQGFHYVDDRLCCGSISLQSIADQAGTPTYVYSGDAVRENYRNYDLALEGLPHDIFYSVKANSSLGVLALLANEGAGFDIVSGGELYRVLKAGGDPSRVVFSGVGKTADEMRYALEQGIGRFNCESKHELRLLRELAIEVGFEPNVSLRVNPDINAETHPYIATGLSEHKFGIGLEEAEAVYTQSADLFPLVLNGISCHIGSQIFDTSAFNEALQRILALASRLQDAGIAIESLDVGGGLGVGYEPGQNSASITDYGRMLSDALKGTNFRLGIEPGRSIVGQAGVLLTRVLYRKPGEKKTFVVVDGAMNDLIRPALYQAHHEIMPVYRDERSSALTDVVGPVCETGDFLARHRELPTVEPGELLAVATAGAYGFVQASNYNSRPRAAEVLVDADKVKIIRQRELWDDLIRGETLGTDEF